MPLSRRIADGIVYRQVGYAPFKRMYDPLVLFPRQRCLRDDTRPCRFRCVLRIRRGFEYACSVARMSLYADDLRVVCFARDLDRHPRLRGA